MSEHKKELLITGGLCLVVLVVLGAVSGGGGLTGGGTIGSMINTGANTVGNIPRASDSSPTNYMPSLLIVDAAGNVSLPGVLRADSAVFTNGISSLLAGPSTFYSITVTNAAIFNGSLQLPIGAAPTTDAFGEIAGYNDAWAAGRGVVQFWDGTANTYLVGVLASDVPTNGQVPTWNTGGMVTWETPTGGGSSAPTNTLVSLSTPATANGVWYASGTPGTNALASVGVTVSGTTNLSVTGTITESANGIVSQPALALTGLWYSGGSATTTKPTALFEPAGTTSTAWNTAGTGLGINAASGFTGNLIDLQLSGASKFKVDSTGVGTFANSITSGAVNSSSTVTAGASSALAISGRFKITSGSDGNAIFSNTGITGLTKIQFGVDDAAPDSSVLLGAGSGVGADIVSGGIVLATGTTTGIGKPASAVIKTSIKGTTSNSSANSLKTRYHIEGSPAALTDNTATLVFNLALASGKFAGGRILSTVYATDGTDHQVDTSQWVFSAANKAGTVTAIIKPVSLDIGALLNEAMLNTSGTLTNGWTVVANGNGVDFKVTAKSSLTTTLYNAHWSLELNSNDTGTIVSQ